MWVHGQATTIDLYHKWNKSFMIVRTISHCIEFSLFWFSAVTIFCVSFVSLFVWYLIVKQSRYMKCMIVRRNTELGIIGIDQTGSTRIHVQEMIGSGRWWVSVQLASTLQPMRGITPPHGTLTCHSLFFHAAPFVDFSGTDYLIRSRAMPIFGPPTTWSHVRGSE